MARPSKPILSPDLIYRTALNQLDRTGSLNMPELARELGVSVSSVYHHVKGRTGVLEGVRAVIADWDCGDPDDWEEMVRRWAGHYRNAFARHPGAIPALVGQAVSDPSTLRQYDSLATKLTNTGFSARSIVLSVSALDVLCLGAALDASAPSMVWTESPESSSPLHDAAVEAGLTDDRSRAAFEVQLGWVIAGMSELLAADRTESVPRPDLSTFSERSSS
jgi:AcrR family transcriptional regulator